MAQSLGLHQSRNQNEPTSSGSSAAQEDRARDHQNLRRKIWWSCVIADRWVSAVFGLPMAIDTADCANLNYNSLQDQERGNVEDDEDFLSHLSHLEISIILGKVLKSHYSPVGISKVTKLDMETLIQEIERWEHSLKIRFHKRPNCKSIGHLKLASVSVRFLLYRPFMKKNGGTDRTTGTGGPSYEIGDEDFERLLNLARESVEWIDKNVVLEGFIVTTYSLFVCALVQYHSYVQTGSLTSLNGLTRVKEVLGASQTAGCFVRKRAFEVVSTLYTTAQKTHRERKQQIQSSSKLLDLDSIQSSPRDHPGFDRHPPFTRANQIHTEPSHMIVMQEKNNQPDLINQWIDMDGSLYNNELNWRFWQNLLSNQQEGWNGATRNDPRYLPMIPPAPANTSNVADHPEGEEAGRIISNPTVSTVLPQEFPCNRGPNPNHWYSSSFEGILGGF